MVPTLAHLCYEADTKPLGRFGEFPRIAEVEAENPTSAPLSTSSWFREAAQGSWPMRYFHRFPALILNCSIRPPSHVRASVSPH